MLEFYNHILTALNTSEWDRDLKLNGINVALERYHPDGLILLERDYYENVRRVYGSSSFGDTDKIRVIREYTEIFAKSITEIENILKTTQIVDEPSQAIQGTMQSRWDEETELRIIALNAACRMRYGSIEDNAHKIELYIRTGSFEPDGSVPMGYGFDTATGAEVAADAVRNAGLAIQERSDADTITTGQAARWLIERATKIQNGESL